MSGEITLIVGGSKCGKSSLAENILARSALHEKIYIAAMQPFGEGADEIIARHRKMRQGKGFLTVEMYNGIRAEKIPMGCAVMIEDAANLAANEMFTAEGILSCQEVCKRVMGGIRALAERTGEMIIVSNTVGADGERYSRETEDYIQALGSINTGISSLADNVIECVFGIPIVMKGRIPC